MGQNGIVQPTNLDMGSFEHLVDNQSGLFEKKLSELHWTWVRPTCQEYTQMFSCYPAHPRKLGQLWLVILVYSNPLLSMVTCTNQHLSVTKCHTYAATLSMVHMSCNIQMVAVCNSQCIEHFLCARYLRINMRPSFWTASSKVCLPSSWWTCSASLVEQVPTDGCEAIGMTLYPVNQSSYWICRLLKWGVPQNGRCIFGEIPTKNG